MLSDKNYDLEERTFRFAKDCRKYVKSLNASIGNLEDGKQLIRSSGSVGANYIEANEKLGEKDFQFRLRIARKEAKESGYWLRLLKEMNPKNEQVEGLIKESFELRKILSSILNKVKC
ncbi:four helix bundle protein [Flagellimonas baculiformis]|uniref:four helix bundle protein n=1 Tax=Flagellimonas baculiformis TaxID=3067310 RepID=UPI00296EB3B1|nr:four helix bundle protein [Muricauda sp. D6]